MRRIGSRQIRNIGTLAANIANASPIGDTIPCLMALDATITLRSKRGARDVKADDFILGLSQDRAGEGRDHRDDFESRC